MQFHSARIGEIIVARTPDILEALALGSCIAIFIYDQQIKLGACSHILLPASKQFGVNTKLGKYADTAIPEMIRIIKNKGGKQERFIAKIAGGARMFELTGKHDHTLDVGKRNTEAVRKALLSNNIPILAEDTGADYGRTVAFDLESGVLTVKKALQKVVRRI